MNAPKPRSAVPAPSDETAYDRLALWLETEKAGRDHPKFEQLWDYDPRPDIERLILGFRYLYDSALLVEAGCDTGHIELGLDAARKSVGAVS